MIYALIALVALAGAPLFAVLGSLAIYTYRQHGLDLSLIAHELGRLTQIPLLQTLPMFTLTGFLYARSNAAQRLVRLSQALLGWMPGGLAIVSLAACSLLTAFTGATGVTIIVLGGLLLPALRSQRYGEHFALGLVTAGGSLGLLFLPSLPLILYGVIASAAVPGFRIESLFRAAVLPGLLMIVVLAAYGAWESRRRHIPRQPFSRRELGQALWAARWEVPLPFIVLGGIYTGILVVSDAAVIAAAYTLLSEVVLYREIPLRDLPGIVKESLIPVGAILLILGMGMALTNMLVDQEVPRALFEMVRRHIVSRHVFLMALNVFLLVVGSIMHIYTAIIVVVPLVLPVALQYGIDPVHLGVIVLMNLAIGFCMPPVGLDLFVASLRFGVPLQTVWRAVLPFVLILLVALAVITYAPQLSLFPVK